MIDLSSLAPAELAQLDAAFALMLNALDMLEQHGVIDEPSVNFTDLYDAVNAEQKRRAIQDIDSLYGIDRQIDRLFAEES